MFSALTGHADLLNLLAEGGKTLQQIKDCYDEARSPITPACGPLIEAYLSDLVDEEALNLSEGVYTVAT